MSSDPAQPGPRPTPGDEWLVLRVRLPVPSPARQTGTQTGAGDLAAFERVVLRH